MNGKELFEGMSYVDERFIDEAENRGYLKGRISPWIKAASVAACVCLTVFALHNLGPYLNGKETDDSVGKGAENAIQELGGMIPDQELLGSLGQVPEDKTSEEVPSVILYVEEMTDLGFIGTVEQLADTEIFEIGMKLNVVFSDETRHETANEIPDRSAETSINYSGSYVMVQFVEYDKEAASLIVISVREVLPPVTTP